MLPSCFTSADRLFDEPGLRWRVCRIFVGREYHAGGQLPCWHSQWKCTVARPESDTQSIWWIPGVPDSYSVRLEPHASLSYPCLVQPSCPGHMVLGRSTAGQTPRSSLPEAMGISPNLQGKPEAGRYRKDGPSAAITSLEFAGEASAATAAALFTSWCSSGCSHQPLAARLLSD